MKHEWAKVEGVCIFGCGTKKSDAAEKTDCPKHPRAPAPPRAIPPGIFAGDISHIGDEMRAIAAREGRPHPERKKPE